MTNNETLKKYGLPLFFYVGDTFVNTCGSLVEIVEVEKENLKICGPSGTFDYKPLDILKRLVKKDYTSYKQAPIKSLITQTKTFNLPVNEKESKKLCHYIGATYSDDLKCISIFNGEVIVKGFTRKRIQNCSIEYIKAVLAELPDVDTTDNNTSDYVPSLNFKERNKLLDLAIELKNLKPSERLNKAGNIINYKFNSDLYCKLPGNDSIEKAKNFLNDRYIEFDCDNTVKKTVSTIPTNKQKQFDNWLSELKKATEKERPEIRRNFLLTVLSNHNIIEFYNLY